MTAKVRTLEPGEEEAYVRSVRVPFLSPSSGSAEDLAADQPRAARIETTRALVVEDAGRFVGNAGVRTMDLSVPAPPGGACPLVRMGGVTAVGVHPTHRRRGFLAEMMQMMLADCRRRDEPVAGLIASESIIYRRFGFGLASDSAEYRIDSSRSAFDSPAPEADLRLIDHAEAAKTLPGIFDRAREQRPGEPNRPPEFWDEVLGDRPDERHGLSAFFFAVCDGGYVAYRAKAEADTLRGERIDVVVDEVVAGTPDTEAALWRLVLDLDLVGQVTFRRRALDEPVRWRLSDPRQLKLVHRYDRLYLRLLDVPAALEGRGYLSEGRLVIDALAPDVPGSDPDPAVGRWVLQAGPDGASCRAAKFGEDPDLRLRLTELSSLYLGGVTATTLAAAGRAEELTPGSLDAADRLFASDRSPLTVTGF